MDGLLRLARLVGERGEGIVCDAERARYSVSFAQAWSNSNARHAIIHFPRLYRRL
jgi:hypothetical protein